METKYEIEIARLEAELAFYKMKAGLLEAQVKEAEDEMKWYLNSCW